jgi:2-C-methyl-D-erythritol 2,4-cyclodiphosphate synthase
MGAHNPQGTSPVTTRVGLGFDVHRFSDDPGRPLILGGVAFPGAAGLEGHSDADVVAHAVAEALLGAAGLGDIGELFPDDDPRGQGADSMRLLAQVVELLGEHGWRPVNVDSSVITESPKLAPMKQAMSGRLGEVVGADVVVKGRRPEGMGALGRGEGIACIAVALIERAS